METKPEYAVCVVAYSGMFHVLLLFCSVTVCVFSKQRNLPEQSCSKLLNVFCIDITRWCCCLHPSLFYCPFLQNFLNDSNACTFQHGPFDIILEHSNSGTTILPYYVCVSVWRSSKYTYLLCVLVCLVFGWWWRHVVVSSFPSCVCGCVWY